MHKATKLVIVAIIIVVLGGTALFFGIKRETQSENQVSAPTKTQASNEETKTNSSDSAKQLTSSEVAKHDTRSDCWTIIDNTVYDLTSYIRKHPGGSVIVDACGTDGTSLFATQGGEGKHSSRAQSDLDSLKIGTLQQ